jgi:hypothetical protein
MLKINREIKADQNRPVLEQRFDSLDEVTVELLYLEGDALIDGYMEQYRTKYAGQFERPEIFDAFVGEYRKLMRRNLREFISATREMLGLNEDGEMTGDGDGI